MIGRLLERARAFSMIAEHLPETRRAEIAEALAAEVETKRGAPQRAAEPALPTEAEERSFEDPPGLISTANYLARRGYTEGGLVAATARLTALVTARWRLAHGNLDQMPAIGVLPVGSESLIDAVYEQYEVELRRVGRMGEA